MKADDLTAGLWDAIAKFVERKPVDTVISICDVVRSDAINKLIWCSEFGPTPIPLVTHTYSFSYYDVDETGLNVKRGDITGTGDNPQYLVKLITPKKGQQVIIFDPDGSGRFPFCIGTIQSTNYWES